MQVEGVERGMGGQKGGQVLGRDALLGTTCKGRGQKEGYLQHVERTRKARNAREGSTPTLCCWSPRTRPACAMLNDYSLLVD